MVRGVATVEPAADPKPFGAADTAFGLDVMRAWCAQNPGQNLVFSPSTLASALGMAYLGARGATAAAMAGVLHLPESSPAALAAGLQARLKALSSLDGPGVTVAASDQVWTEPTLTTLRSYLDEVATGTPPGSPRPRSAPTRRRRRPRSMRRSPPRPAGTSPSWWTRACSARSAGC